MPHRPALALAAALVLAGPVPGLAQTTHTHPAAPATTSYQIMPRLSQASYAVDEVFLRENNRLFTAVGVTPGVMGEIVLNRERPAESRIEEIVVDVQQFTSDSERRDRAIRRGYLESERYPHARLTNAKLEGLPATITEGTPFHYTLTGDLTVHGVTRPTSWEGEARVVGDTLTGVARAQVKMSDFGIEVPRLLALRAADEVKLEIRYVALRRER
jgi:polyisoprenoid-binding protein YceI